MSENTTENGVAKNVVATQDASQEAADDASTNAVVSCKKSKFSSRVKILIFNRQIKPNSNGNLQN